MLIEEIEGMVLGLVIGVVLMVLVLDGGGANAHGCRGMDAGNCVVVVVMVVVVMVVAMILVAMILVAMMVVARVAVVKAPHILLSFSP